MSSISGVSSSNSLYGTRNVITGLASGMDTESMIENVVSSYKNKIASLQQKRTKTEWTQEAYRSIINKMSVFADKYTSYRSSNNLMSTSFFDQAVKTVSKGKYADKVSAAGRSSSNVQIDRVLQLASAATYKLSGAALDDGTSTFGSDKVSATATGEPLDLDGRTTVGNLNGSVTLAYGGSNSLSYLSLKFDETKTYDDAKALVEDINKQLSEQSVSIGTKTYTGKELLNNVIKAEVSKDGKSITFTDPKKNGVYVSDASGSAKQLLLNGKETSSTQDKQIHALTIGSGAFDTTTMSTQDYLTSRGGSLEITLDGKTKTIQLPGEEDLKGLKDEARDKKFMDVLQKNINDAFGEGKLTVNDTKEGEGIQFQFEADKGSTFSVTSGKAKILGFGESERVTSYLNTGKTLGDLLNARDKDAFADLGFTAVKEYEYDKNGNVTGSHDKVDAEGHTLYSFKVNGKEIGQFNEKSTLSQVMNAMNSNSDCGVKVGYSKLTNEVVFTAKDTGEASGIDFTDSKNKDGKSLAAALFGNPGTNESKGTYTKGQDAIFEATVNGTSLGRLTRSSNSIDMDGMTVNLKGTFGYEMEPKKDADGNAVFSYDLTKKDGSTVTREISGQKVDGSDWMKFTYYNYNGNQSSVYGKEIDGKMVFNTQADGMGKQMYAGRSVNDELWFFDHESSGSESIRLQAASTGKPVDAEAVSFETSSDADKIVDVVKQMVEDYNTMATEIKNAYSTLPVQRSNGAYYEPLTDEDREDMSESAAEAWEKNAKAGILFGDRDLASLYQRLTSAVSMTGENGAALRAAGITVNYSNGLSTLEFNETKFRDALNNDPDSVRDAFTASTDSGAKANGLMQALKQPLDTYGKTSGGKGVLVDKAGSPLAPSTMYNNTIQKELNNIDDQIEKWQDKMSDQVDYYTNQFSRLEQLIQQMNSQSSYFSQLMGG